MVIHDPIIVINIIITVWKMLREFVSLGRSYTMTVDNVLELSLVWSADVLG